MSSTSQTVYPMGMTGKAGGDQCRLCGAPRRGHYMWLGKEGIADHEFELGEPNQEMQKDPRQEAIMLILAAFETAAPHRVMGKETR